MHLASMGTGEECSGIFLFVHSSLTMQWSKPSGLTSIKFSSLNTEMKLGPTSKKEKKFGKKARRRPPMMAANAFFSFSWLYFILFFTSSLNGGGDLFFRN